VLVFGALTLRVAQLQLMSGNKYQQAALLQSLHRIPLTAERGTIYDRNGRDLALSIERTTIYADPTLVTDPLGEAARLAPVLHVDQATLLARLSAKGTTAHPNRFAYLARTVSDDVAQAAKSLNLPGIGFVPESARSYPAGSVGAPVLGRVGTDDSGLDGIEYLLNGTLEGHAGELVVEQDPQGHDIPGTQRTRVDAQRGTDVVLSIDEDVQWEAEHALLDQVENTQAKAGMAAVIDTRTGDLLALASATGATATKPAHLAGPDDHNVPLTDLYEPGSTSKLITISWALEHGLITPDSTFTVPYSIKVAANVPAYKDAEWHKTMVWKPADILRESSDVGTIEIAQRMTGRQLFDAERAFGFGQKTSVAWAGQPSGYVLPPSQYWSTGKYSSAIGYGATVTGVQVLDALTTIANDGVSRPPRLVIATIDGRGVHHDQPLGVGRRVVSTNTAALMTQMLEGVVTDGTGACASIPQYTVAGKTGTAAVNVNGTYAENSNRASFEGFAPAGNPRYAAIVVMDQPAHDFRFGASAAAPVFSELMQFTLTHNGVPATDVKNTQYNQAQAAARAGGNVCSVPHGQDLTTAMEKHAAAAVTQPSSPGQPGGTSTASLPTSPDSLPPDPTQHP